QPDGGARRSAAAAAHYHGGRDRRRARPAGCGARRRRSARMKRAAVTLRTADPSQARKLHALITANLEEGRLLPRTRGELDAHADRFTIALRGRTIVGCAELAPLSPVVAEVRSLAVDASVRRHGVGTAIVDELRRRARREGFEKLCAFTHAPGYFIHMGFSIVPHLWLPEK